MDNVRCYFRDGNALGRIDVSQVDDFDTAIDEVKFLLWQSGDYSDKHSVQFTVLAVAK